MDMGGEHLPVIDGSDAGREHSNRKDPGEACMVLDLFLLMQNV